MNPHAPALPGRYTMSPTVATTREPKVVVPARIPLEQREELERRAAEDDRTVSWLIRQAVDQYLTQAKETK